MNQFISQMATMVETITGLQLVVNQSHMETQLKLDQITTHLQIPQESLFDDSDAEHDSESRKRKSRRPSEADKNKTILSTPRTYATPVPSAVSASTTDITTNTNEQRLANLENTLTSGMQQMETTTNSMQNLMSQL